MSALIDRAGKRYGWLVAIRQVASIGRGARWLCECRCGTLVEVEVDRLRRRVTLSCGCWRGERMRGDTRKLRGSSRPRDPIGRPPAWVTKAQAILIVWQVQSGRASTMGSRNSASATLGEWRRDGTVRTGTAPEMREPYHKHDPVLYRRVDVLRRLSAKAPKRPDVRTADPEYDPELDRLLRAGSTRKRRLELGIATLGLPKELR
jgi:hypothetical protein